MKIIPKIELVYREVLGLYSILIEGIERVFGGLWKENYIFGVNTLYNSAYSPSLGCICATL